MINKKNIITFSLIVIGLGLFINLQSLIVGAEASVDPISVSTNELGFGIVFPGENLEKTFVVTLIGGTEELDFLDYRITQTPKPGYNNLCPFLEKINEEGEGDTESRASLNHLAIPPDASDTWKVVLNVPAIEGFVAQDHNSGIISEGGNYGCDIGVEIIEE